MEYPLYFLQFGGNLYSYKILYCVRQASIIITLYSMAVTAPTQLQMGWPHLIAVLMMNLQSLYLSGHVGIITMWLPSFKQEQSRDE